MMPQIVVKRERWPGVYRARGVPLVSAGQSVAPDQPVLRLLRENGSGRSRHSERQRDEKDVLRPSPPSDLSADEIEGRSRQQASDSSEPDESVPAGLYGHVVGFTSRGGVVIECRAVQTPGVIGAGTQVVGVLTEWQSSQSDDAVHAIPPGAILVVSEPLTFALLHQAANSGVVGIVAGSIELRDLEGFLRTDLLQLLTSDAYELMQAHLPALTLLFTEGIGSFRMRSYTLELLRRYEGSIGLLAGTTSVRHKITPDLIISLPYNEEGDGDWQPSQFDASLYPGVQVRVRAGEYKGAIGLIDYFFAYDQLFRAGIRARAVRLRLEDGSFCIVPLALLERTR